MPQNKNTGNFYEVLEVQKTYPIKISSTHLGSGCLGRYKSSFPWVAPMATEMFDPIRGHLIIIPENLFCGKLNNKAFSNNHFIFGKSQTTKWSNLSITCPPWRSPR